MEEKPKRRKFSDDQKRQFLAEAEQSNVSVVARKYGLSSSQLFSWRQLFRGGAKPEATVDATLASELRRAVRSSNLLEERIELIAERILSDLRSGKITSYNAANAIGSLSRAATTLQCQRVDAIERLEQAQLAEGERDSSQVVPPEVEREAERMLVELIKARLDAKKQAMSEDQKGEAS